MSMNSQNPGTINYLDQVRVGSGGDFLKKHFRELMNMRSDAATNLINADNLRFSTLYTLQSELTRSNITYRLSLRNNTALKILSEIRAKESSRSQAAQQYTDLTPITNATLKWMFTSGSVDDGLNSEYDEIMDITALLLTRLHKDKSILPQLVDLTFNRHKKGAFIYDAVLAIFESRDPQCIPMIASRFLSNEPKDVELARKLLSFVPGIEKIRETDGSGLHSHVTRWFQENQLFLYYTGESFQRSPDPIPYAVSLDAKYLCKPVDPVKGVVVNEYEQRFAQGFKVMDHETKVLLSTYSYKLYQHNQKQWSTWLHYPVAHQIKIARAALGGIS